MELLDDEKTRDFSFLILALALHLCALCAGKGLRWDGPPQRAPESSLPIELAAALPPEAPQAQPQLAPVAAAPKPRSPLNLKRGGKISQKTHPLSAERRRLLSALRQERLARENEMRALRAAEIREQVRLMAERRAQAQAREALRKAEISQELAALKEPETALTQAPQEPASGRGVVTGEPAETPDAGEGALTDFPNAIPKGDRYGGPAGLDAVSWSLDGPLGSRRLLKRAVPESPEWLARRGLEVSVEIKFQVREDGSVKRGAVIKKTSGFPEVDRRALDALRLWKFEPRNSRASETAQPWGVVTFRFLIS
ncbi:MAG: TonB family protein [Elusimicrobia bacterium]|nr:TonB family protein [Elusimicrobiota bacterium]